ncbi:hypothetical protein [Effusibacillus pohliae]|uniref:hypothetical protein n=1 Tax=Effusibacillus pohliae TaxID=232270 RepID=UPI0003647D42|nr:hypothetical protein [Effusibacillus pohliae]
MLPQSYDVWKTAAPEPKEPEPVCECDYCGVELFAGDKAIRLNQTVHVCSAECFLGLVGDQHNATEVTLQEVW